MAELAVQAALQILTPFIIEAASSLFDEINRESHLRSDLLSITGTLRLLKAFLADSDQAEGTQGTELLQSSVRQIRDLAYRIEDAVEEFKLHLPHHFHQHRLSQFAHDLRYDVGHRSACRELSSKVKTIKNEVENHLKLMKDLGAHASSTTAIPGPSSRFGSKLGDYCHGLREGDNMAEALIAVREGIIKELLSAELQRLTMSIVGPSGSGKTVLAWDVYEDRRVQEQFECRAWVPVSSSLDKKELLRIIAGQFWRDADGESSYHEGARVGQLQDRLNRDLKDKRYLVVLDNVLSELEWRLIEKALPRGFRGSRIIVTSCNSSVASSCSGGWGHVHRLEGLPWQDSWDLFCGKVFGSNEGEYPAELIDWVEKLVKKCEGQPRALITVARELSKKPRRPSEWKAFHDTLGRNDPLMTSLWRSFRNLRIRSSLKSCFFYFSVFPEDYSVPAEKLMRLWIAEGFVEGPEEDRERRAEEYLAELIGFNLVQVSMTDLDGRPKSCRVLNLVREFIISKAKEQNFVGVISTGSTSAGMTKARRISLVADATKYPPIENSDHVRSAFLFGKDSSFNLNAFKLMRVLEMKGAPLQSFPKGILKLHLLRYLSLRHTQIRKIPRSIEKLSLLETLDLKQTFITELPHNICKLQNLRYLLVYHDDFENPVPLDRRKGVVINGGVGALSQLRKLSLIKVNRRIITELSKLANLRKLRIVGLKPKDGKKFCESLQKMRNLSTLDISADTEEAYLDLDGIPNECPGLEVLHHLLLRGRLEKLPRWISALKSVTKIRLRWTKLGNSPLEALQDLPNLMELELIYAYTGDSLVFTENTFKRLKVLTVEGLGELNMVVVQQGAMPGLERLKICKCWRMITPPQGIRDLSCLTELLVPDMHRDFYSRIWNENYTNISIVTQNS